MHYMYTATTRTLSPHILPIEDLKQMLSHIEETLPPAIHLPMSSEDTLHFIDTYVPMFWFPIDSSCYLSISLYRIICNNFQYTKFLPLILLREISQHDMMSIPNIFESHRMKLWQWKFHNTSSAYVKKLMDSFAILIHLFNCLPTLHLASQPYMPRTQPALPLDAHYKSGRLKASAYPYQLLQMYGYWLQPLLQWQLE